ncbi:pyruvate kinase, partial [bacterium]|nr:pyruvate kinase [bacterium]
IMMDVKGPEIRTGALKQSINLTVGQLVDVTGAPDAKQDGDKVLITSNYPPIIRSVPVGGVVLIDNGLIQLRVLDQKGDRLCCKVEQPGL